MLQNVCFDKLNVFRLCKIVYACHMFLYLYLSLLFFKNKQITPKNKENIFQQYINKLYIFRLYTCTYIIYLLTEGRYFFS
jgi:hypothetical protein